VYCGLLLVINNSSVNVFVVVEMFVGSVNCTVGSLDSVNACEKSKLSHITTTLFAASGAAFPESSDPRMRLAGAGAPEGCVV